MKTATCPAIQTGVMTRRRALALAASIAAGTRMRTVTAKPTAESWTYAGNAMRTGVYSGSGLHLDQEITELWRIAGGQSYVPAAVADGTVFYAPSEVDPVTNALPPLIAVDARTGNERWRHDPPAANALTFFQGEMAIADGLLVATTNTGVLVALDAETGAERWLLDLKEPSRWAAPAIVDGVLYTSDLTSVNAIELADTPVWLWKSSLGDGDTSAVSATVTVDGDDVIVTSVRPYSDVNPELKLTDIHVLNRADGNELFRFETQNGGEITQVAMRNGMLFGRVDGLFAQSSAAYLSLSLEGEKQWSVTTSSDGRVHPAVDGDLVFCGTSEGLMGLDARTGETVWISPRLSPLNGSLVLIGEVIYAGAKEAPAIYAFSAKDGTLLKTIDTAWNGMTVVGIVDGVLIARSGGTLRAYANPV